MTTPSIDRTQPHVTVEAHVPASPLPLIWTCTDWNAARRLLGTAEFLAVLESVEFVTITPQEGR